MPPSSGDSHNQQVTAEQTQPAKTDVIGDDSSSTGASRNVENADNIVSPMTQRRQESIGNLADFFGVSAEINDKRAHSEEKADAVAMLQRQSNDTIPYISTSTSKTAIGVHENVLQRSDVDVNVSVASDRAKGSATKRSGYLSSTCTPPTEDDEEERHGNRADEQQSSYMLSDTIEKKSDAGGGIGAALSRSTKDKDLKASIPSSSASPPEDFIARDGHLWRSKFCIFTDGVLYFYKNQDEADSMEAQKEREDTAGINNESGSVISSSSDYLSKSPMARPNFLLSSSVVSDADSSRLWEKRVAIENVGACRSCEEEHGVNSFMLLESGEDERGGHPLDTLILKAGSSAEMDDWMLQFQRSIASLMRKMILSVDQTKMHSSLPTDIMLPRSHRYKGIVAAPRTTVIPSPKHRTNIIPSPKHASPPVIPPFLSLSHGHGRNDMHRRRLVSRGAPSSTKADYDANSSKLTNDSRKSTIRPVSREVPIASTAVSKSEEILPSAEPKVTKYVPPHLRKSSNGGKYIPPHLRKKKDGPSEAEVGVHSFDLRNEEARIRGKSGNLPIREKRDFTLEDERKNDEDETPPPRPLHIQLGGCAESPPRLRRNRKESSVSSFGGEVNDLRWEVGGISEVGKRDSNEDSFVCVSNFALACDREKADVQAMFAIFDGHCGSSAARFAANNIVSFLDEALCANNIPDNGEATAPVIMKEHLMSTIARLDHEICSKSEWECGSTALVALVVEGHVVLANLGDCRGVVCRSSKHEEYYSLSKQDDWNFSDLGGADSYVWKEVTKTHSPSMEVEKKRIEGANGWITHEREVCISQLQRVDLCDEDVVDILKRCFSERLSGSNLSEQEDSGVGIGRQCAAPGRVFHTSRVCGELAVSRALGDKDFKAKFNTADATKQGWWNGPDFLPYPDDHSNCFQGDLVIAIPEIEIFSVGDEKVHQEFLLLACDGLWDVMDPNDAVRVARDLLFTKKVSAEIAAARLAEIAIHLGSADNTTVILIRFYR